VVLLKYLMKTRSKFGIVIMLLVGGGL